MFEQPDDDSAKPIGLTKLPLVWLFGILLCVGWWVLSIAELVCLLVLGRPI